MNTPMLPPKSPVDRVVLITGFDPFGGAGVNPSWLAASALDGRVYGDHRVVAGMLPTVFGKSIDALNALIDLHHPELVISVGQAGGRPAVSMERVAINVDDARIADNAGAQPLDVAVVAEGPAAYFSTLPIKAMRAAMVAAGLPAEVSQTAGTFVCNHVFYGLMHRLATDPAMAGTRGGCIHVPWLPEQGLPALALHSTIDAIEVGIKAAIAQGAGDVALYAGATH